MKNDSTVRLNRFLSMSGVTSRRKADELIAAGRVSVNGRTVSDLGTKIDPSADTVFLDGRQVAAVAPKLYVLLNNPKDTITTLSDERGRRSVRDFINTDRRIFPVGRLDRHTTGVLILTNDGDFANAVMHPRNKVSKTYLVTTDRPVAPEDLRRLAAGIRLSDGLTAPAEAGTLPGTKNTVVEITIREGRNRQIHRMFEAAGYEVRKLDRIAYGPVTCDGLPRGAWRYLSPVEVRSLLAASESGSGAPRRKASPAGRTARKGPGRSDPRGPARPGRGRGKQNERPAANSPRAAETRDAGMKNRRPGGRPAAGTSRGGGVKRRRRP